MQVDVISSHVTAHSSPVSTGRAIVIRQSNSEESWHLGRRPQRESTFLLYDVDHHVKSLCCYLDALDIGPLLIMTNHFMLSSDEDLSIIDIERTPMLTHIMKLNTMAGIEGLHMFGES